MEDISEQSTKICCWVCSAGKMLPASNILYCTIYYGFKRMKEEQGLLIQQIKITDVAGIERFEPMTSMGKTGT
jgi:hypothetical protein